MGENMDRAARLAIVSARIAQLHRDLAQAEDERAILLGAAPEPPPPSPPPAPERPKTRILKVRLTRAEVLQRLAKRCATLPQPFTPKQGAEILGEPIRTFFRDIKDAVAAGLLVREDRGTYRVAPGSA